MLHNPVGWFEIPTANFDRAITFYEQLFGITLQRVDMPELPMAFFPSKEASGASGALVYNPHWYKPTLDGVLIYFTSPSGDLDADAKRLEELGAKVWGAKEEYWRYGHILVFEDTEGNRIALHTAE